MTVEQINILKTQHGIENLKVVFLDNARVFNVPRKDKNGKSVGFKVLKWDDANEILTQISDSGKVDASLTVEAVAYEYIQNLIFECSGYDNKLNASLTTEELDMIKEFTTK